MKLTLIVFICLLTSCGPIRKVQQGYQDKRIRMDSVLRTMTPEEVREYKAQNTTAKILVGVGVVIVIVNTVPILEYPKAN